MLRLTVYSQPDCHLCDQMIAELGQLVAGRAELEIVDINDDEELLRRYAIEIPVLVCGDEELSRYRLDHDRLNQFLQRQSA